MTTRQRVGFDRLDREGRRLAVTGEGDDILFRVQDPHTYRGVNACYELDDYAAVGLAKDLLERAVLSLDCDEITAAVAALRELERRDPPEQEERYDAEFQGPAPDEWDWRTLV